MTPYVPSQIKIRTWLWYFFVFFAQWVWSGHVAHAAGADPFLKLNIGSHSAKIRSLAGDAAGTLVLTTSDDKTAKLWNALSGELLRTFRVPIGFGNEGKIFTGAISPDGQRVALGGWTSLTDVDDPLGREGFSVYIFDRFSGQLLNRIPRQINVIQALSYSHDGEFLAVALGGEGGIRIFRKDGTLFAEDKEYETSIFGLDFDRSLRLVTSSRDGDIRLYQLSDDSLDLLSRVSLNSGAEPDQIRFSPNSKVLLVGFNDTPQVTVLDSHKLTVLHHLSPGPVRGNLRVVAWSTYGDYFFAGGSQGSDNSVKVHRWKLSNPTDHISMSIGTDSVTGLVPVGDDLLYTTSNTLGRADQAGTEIFLIPNQGADFRRQGASFNASADGTMVSFKFRSDDQQTYSFSLGKGVLALLDSSSQFPLSSSDSVSDLQSVIQQIGDLEPYELVRAVHHQKDKRKFVVGTDFRLRFYNAHGRLLWSLPSPDSTWVVRISENNQWVIAAFGDSTIRWYDANTGKERLAFFVASDRKRWIIWTPEGNYYSAPGAEDLIGWHINNGRGLTPDFFPAARFRAFLFNAKLIGSGLEDISAENKITKNVTNYLPPIVRIRKPLDHSEITNRIVNISFDVSTAEDSPISTIKFRLNGRQVRPENIEKVGDSWEVLIDLPEGENTVSVFAENRHGVSTSASVTITRQVGDRGISAVHLYNPKLYILAIGVSTYSDPAMNLTFAAKDADDFVRVMSQQKGKLYEDVKIRLIKDRKASREEIAAGLDWLKSEVTSKDVGMVFMAGHGLNDVNGRFFFLPHNANLTRLISTAISSDDIRDALGSLAGKSFLFIDSCHSGNAFGTARLRSISTDSVAFINELTSAENGVVVFSASTGRQVSFEDKKWGNGAFTKALVEGISGGADFSKSTKITHKGLDFYIAERVKELTNGLQTPVSISPEGMPDFPIALTSK